MESGLFELIDKVYEAALNPQAWPAFLDRFAECVSGNRGTSLMLTHLKNACGDRQYDQGCLFSYVRHEPAWVAEFDQYYYSVNPFVDSVANEPEGKAYRSSQFLSDAALARTEYYNDFMRREDLFYGLGGVVARRGAVSAQLTTFRAKREGDFGQTELDFLQQLMPHLRRACTIHFQLFEAQLFKNACLDHLHALPIGVILLDKEKRAIFLNRMADAIVQEGHGLRLNAQGRCVAAHPSENSALQRLIEAALSTARNAHATGGGMPLSRPHSDKPLAIMLCPISANALPFFQVPCAMLLVSDPERVPNPAAETLARLYELSPAEAQLAAALANGTSLTDFSETHDLSVNTVRAQLKQILLKTGTHRQTELVKLILTGPAVFHRR